MSTPRVNFDDLTYDIDGLVLYEGTLFTGDAFELYPSGAVAWVASYRAGRGDGMSKEYYPGGALRTEEVLRNGVYDGIRHEYGADGRILKEEQHAAGILLKRLEPDEKGLLRVTFELTRDHPNHKLLPPEFRG